MQTVNRSKLRSPTSTYCSAAGGASTSDIASAISRETKLSRELVAYLIKQRS